jgi:hypothetical protein
MMEFCGRSHDYFSRVKAADKNKILGNLSRTAARCCGWRGLSADFMGFNEGGAFGRGNI